MDLREAYETMAWGPAPESAAPARRWIAERGPDFHLFLDGAWRPAADGRRLPTFEPGTGARLATLAEAGPADVEAAVAAARRALPAWRDLPDHARARYLYALARQVQKHARLLAVLESLDNGKPIRETRDLDVPLVARHLYHHAGWAQLRSAELPGHEPVGVCAQVIPWNFPLLMLAWKVAPALAAGCTVVLKPAEHTSLTALAFAELAVEVGLPPGVLNVITGAGETGAALVAHPDVDKVAFTGSTEVGRRIREATAGQGKALTLELGGKSPFLVFDDADLDGAVEGLVDAIFFNQGQVCCAGSRLLVHEAVEAPLLARLRARMARLRVGPPLDKAIDVGAIVAPVQLERIRALCAAGRAEGADCWQPDTPLPETGWYFPPTLFTGVAPADRIAQEEIFGPVLVAMSFRSPDEAVALANDSRYGLAASVWSQDLDTALDVAMRIQAGTVWVNGTNQFDAACGFGGYRESGYGREGGREGMWAYLRRAEDAAGAQRTLQKATDADAADEEGDASGQNGHGGQDGRPAASPLPPIDRTAKQYIGGRQTRPDGGYSLRVEDAAGGLLGHAALGNRKDLRDAVEAARAAGGWARRTGHARAQVLYYLAENMAARADGLAAALGPLLGGRRAARTEVAAAVEAWFTWAAWADKHDGAVHDPPLRGWVAAIPEPLGVVGLVCPDEAPLAALSQLLGPLVAMGNRVVAVPSTRAALVAAELYALLDASDLPGGVINLVTGERATLTPVLADHDELRALWLAAAGPEDGARVADAERRSAGNLKQTWALPDGSAVRLSPASARERLRRATQVKNVWVPHGA